MTKKKKTIMLHMPMDICRQMAMGMPAYVLIVVQSLVFVMTINILYMELSDKT